MSYACRNHVYMQNRGSMALSLPFWIAYHRQQSVPRPIIPAHAPGFAAVFSSAQKATGFLVADQETSFSLRLISRAILPGLIDDLRRMGMHGFCFDPDDAGGRQFLFAEIETAVLA